MTRRIISRYDGGMVEVLNYNFEQILSSGPEKLECRLMCQNSTEMYGNMGNSYGIEMNIF